MDVDLRTRRNNEAPAAPVAADYDSSLRAWEQSSRCPKAAQVVQRIRQWQTAADASRPLDLTHCDLEDCPPIPGDVRDLNLSWNPRLSALPQVLPYPLVSLAVMFCGLGTLPSHWPPRLEELLIAGNRIAALPETLPDSVRTIGAANNRIEQVPEHVPAQLESLGIGTNRIARVPMHLLSMANLKKIGLANNPLTPACEQELRQATAMPDYTGPTLTIGMIGDGLDASEILPASRRAETVRIVPAHPFRAQVAEHFRQGAQYVATYGNQERGIVRPMYRSAHAGPGNSARATSHLYDDSSEDS